MSEPGDTVVYATLRLWHPELDPDAVTAQLAVQPTYTHAAGDRRASAAPFRSGMWALSTKDRCDAAALAEHIDVILDSVRNASTAIRQLVDTGVHGDVFCYALNPVGNAVSLTVRQLAGLADLGLSYNVDVYRATSPGRDAAQIRLHTRSLLNRALRRPGMWGGELALGSRLADLAFAEGRERELQTQAEWLRDQCAWTSTGVKGATEDLPDVRLTAARVASVYATISYRLGWCDLDEPADATQYWKARNIAVDEVSTGSLETAEDLVAQFGAPTLEVGPNARRSVAYFHEAPTQPALWFDIADDRIVACRLDTGLLDGQLISAPRNATLRPERPRRPTLSTPTVLGTHGRR